MIPSQLTRLQKQQRRKQYDNIRRGVVNSPRTPAGTNARAPTNNNMPLVVTPALKNLVGVIQATSRERRRATNNRERVLLDRRLSVLRAELKERVKFLENLWNRKKQSAVPPSVVMNKLRALESPDANQEQRFRLAIGAAPVSLRNSARFAWRHGGFLAKFAGHRLSSRFRK